MLWDGIEFWVVFFDLVGVVGVLCKVVGGLLEVIF